MARSAAASDNACCAKALLGAVIDLLSEGDQHAAKLELPLEGGWVTAGVVRVCDTVRRPLGPNSAFSHRLLDLLAEAGFDGAPRLLGIDRRGREILTLLPGSPLSGEAVLSESQIDSAALLLRRFHDVAAQLPSELLQGQETVVHGDPGPWNILWLEERAHALIDFDEARPGRRLEDVGYFAWKGLRLASEGPPIGKQRRRLALLARAYGVAADQSLLDAIEQAVVSLQRKGDRERWDGETLARLAVELDWLRGGRSQLAS